MDISKIKVSNTTYQVKDSVARNHLLISGIGTETVDSTTRECYLLLGKCHKLGSPSAGVNEVHFILPERTDALAYDDVYNTGLTILFKTGSNPQITFDAEDGANIRYFKGFSIKPDTRYEINIMYETFLGEWIIAYGIIE